MLNLGLPSDEEIKKQVESDVSPSGEEKEAILMTIEKQTNEIMTVDIDSIEQRRQFAEVIETFGEDVMKQSVKKNSILDKRMTSLANDGGGAEQVALSLEELTMKMRDLDPSGYDFAEQGLLGKIFNPIRKYFERFKTADQEIAEIIQSLEKGRKVLVNDNTTLEIEQVAMSELTKKLSQSIELGLQFDKSVSAAIENARLSGENPYKIAYIEEELLYPLRNRIMDFEQLAIVNQQGIMAIELVRKNNKELIRSIDRAKMVTVNALRTAVTIASAMYDQKIVLEKVSALNTTTDKIMLTTTSMSRKQSTMIHQQASDNAMSIETLKQAFEDTVQTLEEISLYKQEALPRIKQSINDFQVLVAEGERYVQNMSDN